MAFSSLFPADRHQMGVSSQVHPADASIIIRQNDKIAADDRRDGASMSALERTQVPAPSLLTVMVQGEQHKLVGSPPSNVHALFVDDRRRRGKAVVRVLGSRFRLVAALPQDSAVPGAQAEDRSLGGALFAARQEYPVAPQYGRAVADPGQFDPPVVILLGSLDRHRGGIADAGAVGSTKPGPLPRDDRRVQREKNDR